MVRLRNIPRRKKLSNTHFWRPWEALEQRLLRVVHPQYTFFLKRFVTVQNFHTQRRDSAAKPDALRQRANAPTRQRHAGPAAAKGR